MITEVTAAILNWIRSLPKGEQIHGYPAPDAANRLQYSLDMLSKQAEERKKFLHPYESYQAKVDKTPIVLRDLFKPCEDYERCGVCGYDHEYDVANYIVQDEIRRIHEEKGQ